MKNITEIQYFSQFVDGLFKHGVVNTSKLFGYQYSISINDYKIPIMKPNDFNHLLIELLASLRENEEKISKYYKHWRSYTANGSLEAVDQISNLVYLLKKKNFDRRLLVVAWNPKESDESSMTHCLLQFYVCNGFLSCKLYQSFGFLSRVITHDCTKAVLLTYMLCHITGLQPDMFHHSFGKLVVNVDVEAVEEINPSCSRVKIVGHCEDMEDFNMKNFEIDTEVNLSISPASSPEKEPVPCHDEMQYLNLVRDIIDRGTQILDRTRVGTLSIFGPQMVFSLRDNVLPLITTKRVFYRGIIEELLWFIRGSTNGNELKDVGVHIWDKNGSREFLSSIGLGHREEGDLGPVYGFQWRHFGASYIDMATNYRGKGIDQLANLMESITDNPRGNHHIIISWNPQDVPLMALPPCHCLMQFSVDSNQELSCKLYQRSGDMGLGVPFNIASYAILTHMIAHVTGYRPGYLIHTLGDAHVYLNHITALSLQIEREPKPFPTIRFKRSISNIEDFKYEDIVIEDYVSHPRIAMEMAV